MKTVREIGAGAFNLTLSAVLVSLVSIRKHARHLVTLALVLIGLGVGYIVMGRITGAVIILTYCFAIVCWMIWAWWERNGILKIAPPEERTKNLPSVRIRR